MVRAMVLPLHLDERIAIEARCELRADRLAALDVVIAQLLLAVHQMLHFVEG